jgi:hypothetical protein
VEYIPYSREWFNPSRVGSIDVLYDTDVEINMALYLVRARPRKELLVNLHEELSSGKISRMKPFGQALQYALENTRIDIENTDFALWIEEDYCSPPLAMERENVLDRYFNDITVERIESEEEGWNMVHDKPRLWSKR